MGLNTSADISEAVRPSVTVWLSISIFIFIFVSISIYISADRPYMSMDGCDPPKPSLVACNKQTSMDGRDRI